MPGRRTKTTVKRTTAKRTTAKTATAKTATAKTATAGARTRAEVPPSKQPNILVIWGDDIGISNLSCYSDGLMGYRTPNIDRVAAEGVRFTDAYGEQSCTAGRSAFITGQSVYRTGMSKVGIPSSPVGIQAEDPTIAELLNPLGYATGQFGKNHLGDRDEFLPTNHGFDEFFGNLYHLNAEEEPENADFPDPKEFPEFNRLYHPRGVIHSWAKPDGTQRIQDTGPLTRKRMETADDEFVAAAADFIRRQHKARKPFFVWVNTTHMHFRTHTKRRSLGQSGRWQSPYHDTMIDHDKNVGTLLDLLDSLGIADDTIVMYSTDNGPHMNSWPDGGMTPFRSEKNTNWEGAFRVPCMIRWPGRIEPGTVSNEIVAHLDWLPTFLAAAGEPEIKAKLLKGHRAGSKRFKVHLDGYNLLPYLTGEATDSERDGFFYFSDDGDLVACGSTTGRSSSWSNEHPARCGSGRSRSRRSAFRSSSTCAPIRSNVPTSPRTRTTIGSSIGPTWSAPRRS
jgi:arylsulfatase A-like enzyme